MTESDERAAGVSGPDASPDVERLSLWLGPAGAAPLELYYHLIMRRFADAGDGLSATAAKAVVERAFDELIELYRSTVEEDAAGKIFRRELKDPRFWYTSPAAELARSGPAGFSRYFSRAIFVAFALFCRERWGTTGPGSMLLVDKDHRNIDLLERFIHQRLGFREIELAHGFWGSRRGWARARCPDYAHEPPGDELGQIVYGRPRKPELIAMAHTFRVARYWFESGSSRPVWPRCHNSRSPSDRYRAEYLPEHANRLNESYLQICSLLELADCRRTVIALQERGDAISRTVVAWQYLCDNFSHDIQSHRFAGSDRDEVAAAARELFDHLAGDGCYSVRAECDDQESLADAQWLLLAVPTAKNPPPTPANHCG